MNVELGDFIGRGHACVFQIDADFDSFAWLDFGAAELEIRKAKCGIAEAVAEGIEGRASFVPIALALILRSLRGVVRVIDRQLPGIARPRERKLAAWDGVAKKKTGNSVAALRAGIPDVQDSGNVSGGPPDIERAAVEENEHYRLPRCGDGFKELLLVTGQIKRFARSIFAAHVLRFA